MTRVWFAFLFASVTVSILALTRVQARVAKRLGWRALTRDPFVHYWVEISPLERILVWSGICAFIWTLIGVAILRFIARAA